MIIAPLLTNIAVLRVNETVFNFTLEVRYTGTGGGSLTLTNIMFREAGTTAWNQHNQPSVLELIRSGKTWYVLVTNDQFATIGDVEFSFRTQNTMKHGIQMEASQIIGTCDYSSLTHDPLLIVLCAHAQWFQVFP